MKEKIMISPKSIINWKKTLGGLVLSPIGELPQRIVVQILHRYRDQILNYIKNKCYNEDLLKSPKQIKSLVIRYFSEMKQRINNTRLFLFDYILKRYFEKGKYIISYNFFYSILERIMLEYNIEINRVLFSKFIKERGFIRCGRSSIKGIRLNKRGVKIFGIDNIGNLIVENIKTLSQGEVYREGVCRFGKRRIQEIYKELSEDIKLKVNLDEMIHFYEEIEKGLFAINKPRKRNIKIGLALYRGSLLSQRECEDIVRTSKGSLRMMAKLLKIDLDEIKKKKKDLIEEKKKRDLIEERKKNFLMILKKDLIEMKEKKDSIEKKKEEKLRRIEEIKELKKREQKLKKREEKLRRVEEIKELKKKEQEKLEFEKKIKNIKLILSCSNQKFCFEKCIYHTELYNKICSFCEEKFTTNRYYQKFCSKDCRKEDNRLKYCEIHKKEYNRICSFCEEEFTTNRYYQKFCSKNCFKKSRAIEKKIYNKVCVFCREDYITNRPNKKFCSKKCSEANRDLSRKRYNKVCVICEKDYVTNHPNKKFCSKKCYYLSLIYQ